MATFSPLVVGSAHDASPSDISVQVFFAVQTFQSQPLLPPLWRVCGITDSAVSGTAAAGAMAGSTSVGGAGGPTASASGSSAGGAQPAASGAGGTSAAAASVAAGASASTGGAAPAVLRPLQHHAYMRQPSSESLAPVLRDVLARLVGRLWASVADPAWSTRHCQVNC